MAGSRTDATAATFAGSSHEVGYEHGKTFAGQIRRELELALALHSRSACNSEPLFAKAKSLAPWIRQNLPGYLDEVRGLAEGAGLCEDAALFLATSDGLRPNTEGSCTSFYCGPASTQDGSVCVGQTKDTPPREGRYHVMRFRYQNGPEMILLNYAGWLANIGITSRGLGLCGNALYVSKQAPEYLPFSLLKRAILQCSSMDEARQFIEATAWQDGFLSIAARTGEAIFVELILGRAHCRIIKGEAQGHANSILTTEYQHLDRSAEDSPCSSRRQKTVEQALQEETGRISSKFLRTLLADHRNAPDSICRHAQTPTENRTTAAFIANLSKGWMDIAVGHPCTAQFHRHQLAYAN